jgi:hypothetical protein
MPFKAELTDLILGTTTVTTEVATTSVAILSGELFIMDLKRSNVVLIHLETTTFISLVGTTTTESLIETISTTATITSSVLATSTAVANALCQNGNFVNGLLAPCTDPGCQK